MIEKCKEPICACEKKIIRCSSVPRTPITCYDLKCTCLEEPPKVIKSPPKSKIACVEKKIKPITARCFQVKCPSGLCGGYTPKNASFNLYPIKPVRLPREEDCFRCTDPYKITPYSKVGRPASSGPRSNDLLINRARRCWISFNAWNSVFFSGNSNLPKCLLQSWLSLTSTVNRTVTIWSLSWP